MCPPTGDQEEGAPQRPGWRRRPRRARPAAATVAPLPQSAKPVFDADRHRPSLGHGEEN